MIRNQQSKINIGSGALRYFAQGNDGLCGVYAALNAYSFLLDKLGRPLAEDQADAFFDTAIDCLIKDRSLPADRSALNIVKNNADVGGVDQTQIARLCKELALHLDMAVEVDPRPKNSGSVDFREFFLREREVGSSFAMIVATRGGGHWVSAVPHRLKTHFRLIDDGATTAVCLEGESNQWVAGESIVVRLTS